MMKRRTKKPVPQPQREWQVVDTLGVDKPRLSWFKHNAQFVADSLNAANPGRYKIQRTEPA